jgi:uncharacterized membrane protein YhaH (DUF805 family)
MSFWNYRYNRPTYWLLLAIYAAFSFLMAFVLEKQSGYVSEFVLAIICVPRMHDIGKSGKIIAALLAIYFVIAFGLIFLIDIDSTLIALGVINIIITGLLIWLGIIPGQEEANEYGNPPYSGVSFKKT